MGRVYFGIILTDNIVDQVRSVKAIPDELDNNVGEWLPSKDARDDGLDIC